MTTANDIRACADYMMEAGAPEPKEDVLFVTSCRGLPHFNYLKVWNEMNGNPWRLTITLPYLWHHTPDNQPRDVKVSLAACRRNDRILGAIKRASIVIYEHHENYGMFNTALSCGETLWHLTRAVVLPIHLPGWNNHFILAKDRPVEPLNAELLALHGHHELNTFVRNCERTSFGDFAGWFLRHWRSRRLFWTHNHPTNLYTLELFQRMNEKFLHLNLTADFWNAVRGMDLFQENHTEVTDMDVDAYGIAWR